MHHFSDGQKLAGDAKHRMLSDPLESSLTCFSIVLSTLLHVFMLVFESCLWHMLLVGALVKELVTH